MCLFPSLEAKWLSFRGIQSPINRWISCHRSHRCGEIYISLSFNSNRLNEYLAKECIKQRRVFFHFRHYLYSSKCIRMDVKERSNIYVILYSKRKVRSLTLSSQKFGKSLMTFHRIQKFEKIVRLEFFTRKFVRVKFYVNNYFWYILAIILRIKNKIENSIHLENV